MKTSQFNKRMASIILIASMGIIFSQCAKNSDCEYTTSGCIETETAGYMVGTMAADQRSINPNSVAVLYKTLQNALAPIGENWNDPSAGVNRVQRDFPANWNSNRMGNVFGIALDHNNGIFLSATDVYKFDASLPNLLSQVILWSSSVGSAGAAGIYYTNYSSINTTVDLVTTLNVASANTVNTNQIPSTGFSTSTGNSIGNIAFDFKNNQLFATNLEDGRIYRIDPVTGKIKSILDPFVLDNAIAGIAPIGEQLWGISVYTQAGITKVYMARSTMAHSANIPVPNGGVEIWSVNLTASGEFDATSAGSGLFTAPTASSTFKQEIKLTSGTQTKVTDIEFSNAGRMMLAERGHPHRAGVYEFVYTGGSWTTGNNFYLGFDLSLHGAPNVLAAKNAAGGVDYANRQSRDLSSYKCDDIVWASGNAMATTSLVVFGGYPNYVYGVQGMSGAGNNATLSINQTNDLYIDYNCTGWPHYNNPPTQTETVKGKIGDVDVFDQCACK